MIWHPGHPAPRPARSSRLRAGRRAIALLALATAVTGAAGCRSGGAPASATPSAATTSSPLAPSVSPAATSAAPSPNAPPRYVFPVAAKTDYAREHHNYPATDIFANCGSPVLAATDGVVLEVSRVDTFDEAHPLGAAKGGLSVSIRGDDGVRYYGSHLSAIAPGIDAGIRVSAGTRIGDVGQTGNASHICHLHFGISPPCAGTADWWNRRGVVWPWRYLDAWRTGQNLSTVAEVTAWQHDHGCPTQPPPGEA